MPLSAVNDGTITEKARLTRKSFHSIISKQIVWVRVAGCLYCHAKYNLLVELENSQVGFETSQAFVVWIKNTNGHFGQRFLFCQFELIVTNK